MIEWIPVAERSPLMAHAVLSYAEETDTVSISYFKNGEWCDEECIHDAPITHWAPLNPPAGVQDSDYYRVFSEVLRGREVEK